MDNAITRRCKAQDDFVKQHFDRSDWMYKQQERLSSIRLVDLKLIGSHNAASYSISEPFDEYSVCQNARLQSQLRAGVRYVDLRVGLYDHVRPRARVGHGPHHGSSVNDVLYLIGNFSQRHPKEFLIISIKDANWATLGPEEKADLILSVETTFDDVMITSDDSWFDLGRTTLGDVWANNKSVLILYGDSLLRSVANGSQSIVNISKEEAASRGLMPRDLLYDPWANTENADLLFERLDDFYNRRPIPREKFYVVQLVLTANPLLTDSIDQMTAELQRSGRIGAWLREHPDYNIVFLDFVLGVSSRERPAQTALLDEIMGWSNSTIA